MSKKLPAYQQIKQHILQTIHSGEWKAGDATTTEMQLAEDFGVSRMTVNRALKELSEEKVLERRQGSGTFVAQQQFNHTFVEVRNIAEDIKQTGKSYQTKVVYQHNYCYAELPNHLKMLFANNQSVMQIDIIHYADAKPIQYEQRWVDVGLLPEFANQDFNVINTSDYLIEQVPLVKGSYDIHAKKPTKGVANGLNMDENNPALLLARHTYSGEQVVTYVQMWHDGEHFQFSGSL